MAAHHLVGPLAALDIDLADVMQKMYEHYDEVTGTHRGVSSAFLTVLIKFMKVLTPRVIHVVGDVTNHDGQFDFEKISGLAEKIATSPRYLMRLVA
jgi:hypothetical protein